MTNCTISIHVIGTTRAALVLHKAFMGKRQRQIIVFGIFFFALILTAWIAKPPTLKQKMERAGVHFTENDKLYPKYSGSTKRFTYDIGPGELSKLETVLIDEGFRENPQAKLSDGSVYHDFAKGNAQLLFSTGKHLNIIEGKKTTAFFDFPIE